MVPEMFWDHPEFFQRKRARKNILCQREETRSHVSSAGFMGAPPVGGSPLLVEIWLGEPPMVGGKAPQTYERCLRGGLAPLGAAPNSAMAWWGPLWASSHKWWGDVGKGPPSFGLPSPCPFTLSFSYKERRIGGL